MGRIKVFSVMCLEYLLRHDSEAVQNDAAGTD